MILVEVEQDNCEVYMKQKPTPNPSEEEIFGLVHPKTLVSRSSSRVKEAKTPLPGWPGGRGWVKKFDDPV